MNNRNLNLMLFPVLLLLLTTVGCQDERMEIIEPPSDEVITIGETVVSLMQNTVANDGSADNILDKSSCTQIALPVTVNVSGLEVIVESEEDLEIIEEIFDESDDGEDDLVFLFPITVILADYSEVVINSQDELEDLTANCQENGTDDDIECIDFKYPFSVSVFNTDNQVAEVVTFENDKALYEFLDDLEDGDLVGIDFPITLVLANGSEVIANNNNELEAFIEDAVDDCDEDDDNDYNDDDVDISEFVSVLTDGQWLISRLVDDEDDMTAIFTGYVFTFNADGSASATNGTNEVTGRWESDGDDGEIELELHSWNLQAFDEIAEDWKVIAFNSSIIRLVDDPDGDDEDEDEFLTFERP